MEQQRREDPLAPSFLKERKTVVWLGRWAGIFFLLSALGISIWQAVGFTDQFPTDPQVTVLFFWRNLASLAPWGVITILLAELVDTLSADDYDDDEDGNINDDATDEV